MTLSKSVFGRVAALALVALIAVGCASQGPVVRSQGDLTSIKKIAIVPYQDLAALPGPDSGVRSPITGRVFITGPVANRADRFLTEQVVTRVREDTGFLTVPSRNAPAILDDLAQGQGQTWSRRRLLSETGQRLGADAIMVGHVYRFRERAGREFAADSPASVAFDLYIIDCRQDDLLWSAFYDYTQQSLSDNLGGLRNFVRRGARWVTAEELASAAMISIFEDFPKP